MDELERWPLSETFAEPEEVDFFFLKDGNLGMVPRKPKPKPVDLRPVVSMFSLCLSKMLEMSSTRGIRGGLDALSLVGITSVMLVAAGFRSLAVEVGLEDEEAKFDDGTFECCTMGNTIDNFCLAGHNKCN